LVVRRRLSGRVGKLGRLIIAEQPAILQGDWMTDDFVPFTVTLSFDKPSTYMNGALILQKDNPSGLSENDDAIEIPITFE
jgi:hypothetical protein